MNDLSRVSDAKGYRDWNRRMKNAVEQMHRESRKAFVILESIPEKEITEYKDIQQKRTYYECILDIYHAKFSVNHPNLASELDALNRDLWAILVAKTENEALEKISGVPQGEGAWAYIRMHRWFRQTTEQGMINRRTNIMKPDPVQHDYQLASAIER